MSLNSYWFDLRGPLASPFSEPFGSSDAASIAGGPRYPSDLSSLPSPGLEINAVLDMANRISIFKGRGSIGQVPPHQMVFANPFEELVGCLCENFISLCAAFGDRLPAKLLRKPFKAVDEAALSRVEAVRILLKESRDDEGQMKALKSYIVGRADLDLLLCLKDHGEDQWDAKAVRPWNKYRVTAYKDLAIFEAYARSRRGLFELIRAYLEDFLSADYLIGLVPLPLFNDLKYGSTLYDSVWHLIRLATRPRETDLRAAMLYFAQDPPRRHFLSATGKDTKVVYYSVDENGKESVIPRPSPDSWPVEEPDDLSLGKRVQLKSVRTQTDD